MATQRRVDRTGFRTTDAFARHPTIGLAIFILGLAVFGILAYNLYIHGPLEQWDKRIELRMHDSALNSPAWMKAVMVAGFYIGLQGYIVLAVIMGLYFLFKRYWKEFVLIAVGSAGQGGLWLLVATAFGRDRPVLEHPLSNPIPYSSFPSGHTMSAVLGFGLLAYLLIPRVSSRFWKAAIMAIAVLLMLYIGFSRFFMGAHYLIDVLGGLALGVSWTALVFTGTELLFKHKQDKNRTIEGGTPA